MEQYKYHEIPNERYDLYVRKNAGERYGYQFDEFEEYSGKIVSQ